MSESTATAPRNSTHLVHHIARKSRVCEKPRILRHAQRSSAGVIVDCCTSSAAHPDSRHTRAAPMTYSNVPINGRLQQQGTGHQPSGSATLVTHRICSRRTTGGARNLHAIAAHRTPSAYDLCHKYKVYLVFGNFRKRLGPIVQSQRFSVRQRACIEALFRPVNLHTLDETQAANRKYVQSPHVLHKQPK